MERKNDSNNQLKSVSLEDENEKKVFTENLIKPEIEENNFLKKFINCISCIFIDFSFCFFTTTSPSKKRKWLLWLSKW